ncbi:MAG: hypothetical protein R3D57_18120 [Hyphomicrobiaceae bacterium]
MDRIARLAEISVARGCGFGALAIFTMTVGLLGMPGTALKLAGAASLLTTAVLLFKAATALTRPYKHTELWLMLDPADRPASSIAQTVIGRALRDCYLKFAYRFAAGSGLLLTLGLVVSLALEGVHAPG